jgi:hypothetical protein
MPGRLRFARLLVLVVPLAVLCSRAFFELVERRSLTSHQAAVESATRQPGIRLTPISD